nr:hypothetical protein [Tanacetum cinerariifolium]
MEKFACILTKRLSSSIGLLPSLIRLYCWGKKNGVNILKSIDEGAFQMGTVREPLAEGTEGAPHLGPERPRVYSGLSPEEKDWVDRIEVSGPIHEVEVQLGGQDNAIDENVDEQPVQDLALNVDNVFQADDCDAFDSYVDEALMAQTMFMSNLSSADHVNDEARPSYDSDIQSEVQDHDQYQDTVRAHHEEHAMHDNVQLNHVVDSHADYTSDSNVIPYDQYVKDNAVPVVHSNVSSIPNDAYMMIYNDMYEPHAQSISKTSQNMIVENSLTAKLATYKEQVELYERWARPKPYYNELNNVAIGYKNPLCLTRAKPVQPALYNGHEIIKDNHVPAIVHNTEDTLEIAEITKRKMNDKMKDPECVTHKMKSEALKEQTIILKPIKALMVYPPNTPATLVPKVLPMKSQVKIHIFTIIQLFLEFDKTCKKRITPTRLTKGERGFEQTKECYLKEVIPFFKTLKENFEGIQKALTKEIKEMKDVFDELKVEVVQNVVDRKHAEIERKNLLIANDNLIAECLSKEVFSIATNYELNVARFTKRHIANTSVEARCLELKAELSNLRDKSHNDNHDDVSKDDVKPKVLAPGKHLKESVETIRKIVEEAKVARPLDSSIISAFHYTKHSQELLEYAIGTCTQDSHQRDKRLAPAPLFRKKQVTFAEPSDTSNSNTHKHVTKLNTQKTNVPVPRSTGVNHCTNASGSQPRSNTKKNRISPAKGVNKLQVEEQPRTNKPHLRTSN